MEYVLIRKSGGFYCVFDNDAFVINYLTGYKITNGRCGFPLNSLSKVINILEDNSINYIVRENMEDIFKKNYKKNNKYNKILDKGKRKFSIEYRVNSIIENIKKLEYDKLCNLLEVIESNL